MCSVDGPSIAITADNRDPSSSTRARTPRRFPSPSSPRRRRKRASSPCECGLCESARETPTSAASPAPLSAIPGASRRVPLRFTVTFVPAGNTVSRCATSRTTSFEVESGTLANYVSDLVHAHAKAVRFENFFSASPRRASLNSGAGISVRRICCSVTQPVFLSIHSIARTQAASCASFSMESCAARAERVAINKKIQQMEASFTRFVREILAPAGRSACLWMRTALEEINLSGISPPPGGTISANFVFRKNAFRFFGSVEDSVHRLVGGQSRASRASRSRSTGRSTGRLR